MTLREYRLLALFTSLMSACAVDELSDSAPCPAEQECHAKADEGGPDDGFSDLEGGNLRPVTYEVLIPEGRDHVIDPLAMRRVDEESFNYLVMPRIGALTFYSVEAGREIPMPYAKIRNWCYARRAAVDAFLWFGAALRAEYETKVEQSEVPPYDMREKKRYLLPGFKGEGFAQKAWVETARIMVVGELSPGDFDFGSWSNHEATAVNTQNGIRVIDPSFAPDRLLTLDEWFSHFAPAPDHACSAVSPDGFRQVLNQLINKQFHIPWEEGVPHCGYLFGQRLKSEDMGTSTNDFFGTPEEKLLSSRFWTAFEEDLAHAY